MTRYSRSHHTLHAVSAIDPAATHGIVMEETGVVSVGGGQVITVRE